MAPSRNASAVEMRGTKRKRPSSNKPAIKQETRAEIVAKKLHHGVHEARKAAKKTVAFELRKLVKRLKAARAEDAKGKLRGDDPAEMERQLDVLKHADHEQFANTALRTKILKDRLLSQNEDVKAAVADKLSAAQVAPQEPGFAGAKVHGRVLSSKTLAEAVHAVVNSLKEVLDPSLAKAKARGQETQEEDDSAADEEDVVGRSGRAKKAKLVAGSDEDEGEDESEAEADDAGRESRSVDGGDDGDGAGWESGSVHDGDGEIANSSSEDEDEDEGSDDESEESSDEQLAPSKPRAKDSKGQAKVAGGESTFLPSLSVGFTRGDSDASDFSDGEAEAADAPRKNRRGQRARRAIWEKKFGHNANHVKSQREAFAQDPRQSRQHGAGGQGKFRGRRDGAASGAPPRQGYAGTGGAPGMQKGRLFAAPRYAVSAGQGRNAGAAARGSGMGGKVASDDKPLHPSWEAKKRMKEKQSPGIVPAQGKKITFT